MADIEQLAQKSLDAEGASIDALREMVQGDVLVEKDKIRAIEVINKIATTVLDRAYPKLSATKNTNVELNVAKMLAALPTPLLRQVEEYVALQEPKHVESEVRPCPE